MANEDEIRKLANTLKATGVASSHMDAMQKARDIIDNNEKTMHSFKKYEQDKFGSSQKIIEEEEKEIEVVDKQIEEIDLEIIEDNKELKAEIKDIDGINEEIGKQTAVIDNILESDRTLKELYQTELSEANAASNVEAQPEHMESELQSDSQAEPVTETEPTEAVHIESDTSTAETDQEMTEPIEEPATAAEEVGEVQVEPAEIEPNQEVAEVHEEEAKETKTDMDDLVQETEEKTD